MAEEEFFDARIESVDITAGIICFTVDGRGVEVKASNLGNHWKVAPMAGFG